MNDIITVPADALSPAALLRRTALARAQKLQPLRFVLDDALRGEIQQAHTNLDELRAERDRQRKAGQLDEATQPDSLADAEQPRYEIDRMIAACEQIVDAVEEQAEQAGSVLVTQWRRITPADYDVEVQAAEKAAEGAKNEAGEFLIRLGDALARRCYVGAQTPDGQDVELSLDELITDVCNHADVDQIRTHCININRTGAAVDFHHASSGRLAQN